MRYLFALLLVLLCAHPTSGQTNVFGDAFTEAIDTTLASHVATGNHGTPSWVLDIGSSMSALATADGGDFVRATAGCATCSMWYTMTPSTALGADYDVTLALAASLSGQADKDGFSINVRQADNANYYGCSFQGDTQQTFGIIERAAGVTAFLTGPSNITIMDGDIFICSIRGSTIKFKQNGVTIACVVDATLSAAGSAALGWGVATGVTAGADLNAAWHGDDLSVDDYTGLGGDDNCAGFNTVPTGMLTGVGR